MDTQNGLQVHQLTSTPGDFFRFKKQYMIRARQVFGQAGIALMKMEHEKFIIKTALEEPDEWTRTETNKQTRADQASYRQASAKLTGDIAAHLDRHVLDRVERETEWNTYILNNDFIGMWKTIESINKLDSSTTLTRQIELREKLYTMKCINNAKKLQRKYLPTMNSLKGSKHSQQQEIIY